MKRIKRIGLCTVLLVCLMGLLPVSALTSQEVTDSTWSDIVPKALFIQEDTFLSSEMNEAYEGDWWEGDVPEKDTYANAAVFCARGFAVSHDGRYSYWGTLNGGTGVRGAVVLDMKTGQTTDIFTHYDGEYLPDDPVPFSYAKGIDTDDRGYVYVGFAFAYNYNIVNLGIARQEDDGTLTEICTEAVYEFGTPGDGAGIHVGVNGVEVQKIGDRYFCYVMVNYDYDALYCYDVTDPAHPKLNREFGEGGCVYFSDDANPVRGDGFTLDEGYYMDVDPDGVIWLCAKSREGSTGIMQIDAKGQNCGQVIPDLGGYCVEHVGHYLVVGAKSGSTVTVYDDSSFEKISAFDLPGEYGNRINRIQIVGDVLYLMHAESDIPTNALFAVPLNAAGEAYLEDLARNLTPDLAESDTEAPDAPLETVPDVESETVPATVPAESAPTEDTHDDADRQTTAETKAESAPSGGDETTLSDRDDEKKGCASLVGIGPTALLLMGGCAVLYKRKHHGA